MERFSIRVAMVKILVLLSHFQGFRCIQSKGNRPIKASRWMDLSWQHDDLHLTDRGAEEMYEGITPLALSSVKSSYPHSDSGVEVEALMAFKQALNESSRLSLSSWNSTSLSPCQWRGITCSRGSGRVIALQLVGMGLGGQISPLLGRLKLLQKVDLSDNSLSGEIPTSLMNCTHLEYLALANNKLAGAIPPQIGDLSQLLVLNLSTNFYLQGRIPASLGNCSSLKSIRLDFTFVIGEIPDSVGKLLNLEVFNLTSTLNNGSVPASLGNCSSLTVLEMGNSYIDSSSKGMIPLNSFSLSNSQLSGTLPDELGNLKQLQTIEIVGADIKGPFPSWIVNLTAVRVIAFRYDRLSGALPDYLGRLPLEVLNLYKSQFSGKIPRAIGNCSNLHYLDLGDQDMQGAIPPELGYATNLKTFYADSNRLEGKIPSTLSNCSALEILTISYNPNMDVQPLEPWIGSLVNLTAFGAAEVHLTGLISPTLGQLSKLMFLDLGFNNLSGSIGNFLANCSDLQTLQLENNALTGEIPMELWELQQVTTLDIAFNRLTGSLSDGIANMSYLYQFFCHWNAFHGTIPSRFTELPNLQYAALEANNFSGHIPVALGNLSALLEIGMDHNSLSGSIPASMGNLTGLVILELSSNQLTGSIPAHLMRCNQLIGLYLDVNFLDGSIPVDIGQLLVLENLELYNNQLSGELPRTLGLCANLATLDLSYNAFHGELPQDIFLNASSTLTLLNLSHNSFSGPLPRSFGEQSSIAEILLLANNFSGSIPSSLGELQSLQILDLSVNNLNGTIPDALGNLPNLTLLNVSYNQLEGPLPETGIFESGNFSAGWFLGNPELCGNRLPRICSVLVSASSCRGLSCHSGRWAAIISCSTAFGLLAVGVGKHLASRRWSTHKKNKTLDVQKGVLVFAGDVQLSGQDLIKIVDDPTNLIARGTSSSVYKVDLGGGPIAIKILATSGLPAVETDERLEKAISQMQSEARTLAKLRHRNVLKVLGIFSTSKMQGLMLEFMPMGSLHNRLHDANLLTLSWETRLDIALGVAHGLVYLHQDIEVPIIHRDVKPQNILLDADMTPKLGDFGISKFSKVDDPDEAVTASQWCGTIGYIPPEYAKDTRVSTRGDVYSFGIVLLELLTGKRPTTEVNDQDGDLHVSTGDDVHSPLVDWVYKCFSVHSLSPSAVTDPALLGSGGKLAEREEQQMRMFIQVAMLCTQDNPQSRPRMYDVLGMLTQIKRLGKDPVNVPSIDELTQEEEDQQSEQSTNVD